VVLKTVGLLTLAVQSGLHIAAKSSSEISMFEKLFVDYEKRKLERNLEKKGNKG